MSEEIVPANGCCQRSGLSCNLMSALLLKMLYYCYLLLLLLPIPLGGVSHLQKARTVTVCVRRGIAPGREGRAQCALGGASHLIRLVQFLLLTCKYY